MVNDYDYKHLQNVCKIQEKFIWKQISRKQYLDEMEEERLRYLRELRKENQNIINNMIIDEIADRVLIDLDNYLKKMEAKNDR